MLQQFTWQQFLIAALVLSLIWYAILVILLYRKRLNDAIKRKSLPSRPRIQSSYDPREEIDEEPGDDQDNSLIGKHSLPEGVEELSMSQISFAPKRKESEAEPENNDRLGLIPDVLDEMKTLFNILRNESGTKEDFFSLFGLIKSKYPSIKHSPYLGQLNAYILENLPFPLSEEELDTLWE